MIDLIIVLVVLYPAAAYIYGTVRNLKDYKPKGSR